MEFSGSQSQGPLGRLTFLEAVHGISQTMALILDPSTLKCIHVDSTVERHLGFKAEDLMRDGVSCIGGLVNEDGALAILDGAEARLQHKDGSWHWFRVNLTCFPTEGADAALLLICQNITDQKRIEESLTESVRTFQDLADFLPQTVFEMDTTGRLTFANRQAFTNFGYTKEDFDAGVMALQMVVPEDRVRAAQAIAGSMTGGPTGFEYTGLRKDGTTFPVVIHSSAILRNGRPVGLRGILVDISEQKKAEADRQWMQERLRHAEKMEAIGQLAGGVAHDFNNQLSAIQGFASILLDELSVDKYPDWYRFVENIIVSCRRSSELTGQLLAFARRGKYLSVPVDLQMVVSEVAQLLEHSIDKRIAVRRVGIEEAAFVMGDPSQLQNALMNLALNARDAMPDGGELIFSLELMEMDESLCRRFPGEITAGSYIHLAVTDTGIGIDAEILPRIFEPFFTTKDRGKGTGLGLASVYGTVTNHHGTLSVQSSLGKGSCFNIFLPVARMDESTSLEAQERSDGVTFDFDPSTKQILVIEDEELVGQMLVTRLRQMGFQTFLMGDSRAAVERFREIGDDIDVVILDLVMPQLSGRDTFRALRAIRPDVRVIVSSGFSVDGEAQGILDEGAICFLQKPYQKGQLVRALSQAFPSE